MHIHAMPKLRAAIARLKRAAGCHAARNSGPSAGQALDLTDLLGRAPVSLDTPRLQRFLANKVVLITGAGGSIGSEICRQTMRFCPKRMILLDQAEGNLFEIDQELSHRWLGADVVPLVADIADARRIEQIFAAQQPQVIFHCAAHKHVPMMELNAGEAIKNNVLGTKNVADAALRHGAAAFVMVSTDKAVNPTSVMGAAKRCAELYIQSLNQTRGPGANGIRSENGIGNLYPVSAEGNRKWDGIASGSSDENFANESENFLTPFSDLEAREPSSTRFVAVRFGNVLGSSGSVVPIFRKQIEAGGPVTVTHPEMKRFFMTIPEASQLVMQAGAIGQGGEIFVLDMGEPMKILDLARELIRRYGLEPEKDIAIEFTGIRPGEKLYEELACADEQTRPTSHRKIRVWQLPRATTEQADAMIQTLSAAAYGDHAQVVDALSRCVAEYQPAPSRKTREDAVRLVA